MRLLSGDCLEKLKEIEPGSVDMVLADLPYGTTQCKWDTIIPLAALWELIHTACKPTAPVVIFSAQPFSSALVMSNANRFKYEWVWEKEAGTGFLNAKKAPLKSHENILVFCQRSPAYNPQMTAGKPYTQRKGSGTENYNPDSVAEVVTVNSGERYPKTVLRFNRDKNKVHPTQKPVALLEYLIKTYTKEGDIVLDPTMGSGSTGVACKNLNRQFIGIEKEPKYFDIAKERILRKEPGLIKRFET